MQAFDQFLFEQIAEYEGRHDDLIYQAPALYRLLTRLLDDPRLPHELRPLVLAAIAYFILPADIISEELEGPYGYIDDIWLAAYVADQVRQAVGSDEVLTGNWDGEGPLPTLVADLLSGERELVGEKGALILRYIGIENIFNK